MREPFEAVVVGGVGIDTNVFLYGREPDFSVEMNFSQNLDCVGQAGGYSARGFAALGVRTAFVGFVGDDFGGRLVREAFARDGVDATWLGVDAGGTKRSVNLMYPDGRRRNFYDGRGSMATAVDPARYREAFRGARVAHFSIVNWTRRLLDAAREAGAVVSVDLQDVVDLDDPYRRDYVDRADVLFCSCTNHPDPRGPVDHYLRRRPDATVVLGLGAAGCALGTASGVELFPALAQGPEVVDTNGAGDSLAVGFLTGAVLDRRPPREAVWYGQVLARHCCTLRGTSDGLLGRAELDRRLLARLASGRGMLERDGPPRRLSGE